MIKKITVFVLMVFTLNGIISLRTSAMDDTLFRVNIEDYFSWSLKDNNGIYYLESNRIEVTAEYYEFEVPTFVQPNDFTWDYYYGFIVNRIGVERSRIEVYDDETTIFRTQTFYLEYPSAEDTEYLFPKDINDQSVFPVEIESEKYFQIVLILNAQLDTLERYRVLSLLNSNYIQNELGYWNLGALAYYQTTVVDPTDPNQFELLPTTTGTIYDDFNGMGKVYSYVDGYDVEFTIEYNGRYYLNYTFAPETDMSIFEDFYEAFYFTHNEEKFMVFSHGSTSMFKSRNVKSQTFIPYTIWNLSTNQISTINDFTVHVYTQAEESNNVYAYFYIDEFIIDHLLMATITFQYKYNYIFGGGSYQEYTKTLEADEEVFYDLSWQAEVLSYTAIATSVGSLIPFVRWPVLAIGTTLMAIVGSTVDNNPFSVGSVNEIQKITPTTSLTEKLNDAYSVYYPNFTSIDPSLNVFKLYLGQFNDAWSTGIKINRETFNIIELRYMTDGVVYTMKGENIHVNFNPGNLVDDVVVNTSNKDTSLIVVGLGLLVFVISIFAITMAKNPKEMMYHDRN